jgi:DNA-binding winged helix-turn-helix (wHTH) protein
VSAGPSKLIRFGVFELDARTGELRRKGVKVRLQKQPTEVLALLASRPGDLVSRQELRERLWPQAVYVDFEHGVTKAIGKIRQALGDLSASPRYIETLPTRGYRFIAPVEFVEPDSGRARTKPPAASAAHLVWGERVIALIEEETIIGREPGVAVFVTSPRVSRRHARIVLASGTAVVEDLGSKNGTFLNEARIARPVALAHKDVIRVGPVRLQFHTSNEWDSTQTGSQPRGGRPKDLPGPRS